jgi:hypothetical protein
MRKRMKFNSGDKVTYKTPYKTEKGIVKSISDENYTFVVYHCGDDWKNYRDYTAARTPNQNLVHGWK